MLKIRKVRVGDVKLARVRYPANNPGGAESAEGVLLKAETKTWPAKSVEPSDREMLGWTSIHMNLDIDNGQPPGKQLMLALADEPRSNGFQGTLDGKAMTGRVDIPEDDDFFSFTFSEQSRDGAETEGVEVRFHGNHAADFVRALLYWWYRDGFGREAEPGVGTPLVAS